MRTSRKRRRNLNASRIGLQERRRPFQIEAGQHIKLSWERQELPFDIGVVRAVKVDRHPYHFEDARRLIAEFARNAQVLRSSFSHRAAIESIATGKDASMALVATQLADLTGKIDELSRASRIPQRIYGFRPATMESRFRSDEAVDAVAEYLNQQGNGVIHRAAEFPELVSTDDPNASWTVLDLRLPGNLPGFATGPIVRSFDRIVEAVNAMGSPVPDLSVFAVMNSPAHISQLARVLASRFPYPIVFGVISEKLFVPVEAPVARPLQENV